MENPRKLIRSRYSANGLPAIPDSVMHALASLFFLIVILVATPHAALAQAGFGAAGGEGEPNRMQQWLVPTPLPDIRSHALLFRPAGEGPFQLAVISHATTQNVLRRAQMPQPEYRALAAFLVARGFAVLVPERPGHGATGGKYLEDQGGCDEADYARSGEDDSSSGVSHGKMRWGLGIASLTPDMRDQLQVPSEIHGAVVEQVQPGSSADNAGLQQGDIILEVNRHKVQSASDVQQALSNVQKGQDALVLVWSNGGNTFRVLHSPEGA